MTTTTPTKRYKHITAFADSIGLTRIRVYRALEANDPEKWEAYAAFRKRIEAERKQRVEKAKLEIQKLEQ